MRLKGKFLFAGLLLTMSFLSGCASMDGYNSDFSCPQNEKGECIPIESAYQKALNKEGMNGGDGKKDTVYTSFDPDPVQERAFMLEDVKNFDVTILKYEECIKDNEGSIGKCAKEREAVLEYYKSAEDRGRAKEVHGTNMQERVTKLAAMEHIVEGGSSVVPVRAPDTVMEVFIMPYQTPDGFLVSERVLWVVVQPGKWTWATGIGDTSTVKSKLGQTN